MLGKLIKHEFRATARVMGPLYLALLVLALCANASARVLESSRTRFLTTMGIVVLVLFSVAIVAVCVMTLVVMIHRFRTNLLGSEGYLTLTLPATIHEQLWSKLIVSAVWSLATIAAVCLAAVIAVFRISYVSGLLHTVSHALQQITSYYALNGLAFAVELLILLILASMACCLQFYGAMAVGHSFSSHKGLLSVAFFFGFLIIQQILGTVGLFNWSDLNFAHWNLSGMAGMHAFMGIAIACTAIYGAVYYVLTFLMLKHRLNLE
jgi:hypothetical protein